MSMFAVLLLGLAGGGAWWFVHRNPDPILHAASMAAAGDLRETLLVQRNAITKAPASAEARMNLARTLLKAYDGAAAEKGFRAAGPLGADPWAVRLGIGEAQTLQGLWQPLLAELPEQAPELATTARLLLLRGSAQLALGQVPAATVTLAALQAAAPGRPEPLLLAARVALVAGNRESAEASIDAALGLDPVSIEALMLKLALYGERRTGPNEGGGRASLIDRTIAAAPWALAPRLARIGQFMNANDDAAARAELSIVQERFPRAAAARYLDAVLLARAAKYAEADAAFERLAPIAEQFPRAFFFHAAVSLAIGNASTASGLATRYNARFPADLDGVRLLGRALLANGRPDLLIPVLERTIATPAGARDVDLLNTLAAAYTSAGNPAAASRTRQQAAVIAPDNAGVLTSLGLSQLSHGSMAAAVESLDRSAGLSAPLPAIDERLFEAALEIGDLERAEGALARRRALDGESEAVSTMSAGLLLARNDRDGARATLEALAARNPDAVPPRILMARLLLIEGHAADAEALLSDVLAKSPANMLALTTRMQLWLSANALAPALRAVEAAQAASPGDPVLTGMRAELLIRSNEPAMALSTLDAARVSGRLQPALMGVYGQAQFAAGAKDAAVATYREAVTGAPGSMGLRFGLVNMLMQMSRLDEARAVLRDGLARAPGVLSLMSALVALESTTGGTEAALALADQMRAEPRNLPGATVLRGDLLAQAKQFPAAAAAYRAEYAAAPSQSLAFRVARAEADAGQPDAAAPILRDWTRQRPGDADAAVTLAQLDMRAGRQDEARAGLEARLARRPNDAASLNNLAWLYNLKQDPRALDLAERAYALAPGPQTADTLGWIRLQAGDTSGALELLQSALAEKPDDPGMSYHLAVALQKTTRAQDGRKLLELLVARKESFADRAAAETLLQDLRMAR